MFYILSSKWGSLGSDFAIYGHMTKFKTLAVLGSLLATISLTHLVKAHADESVGDKISNTADDASKGMKKSGRKMKRKSRKAHGTDNVGKDAKDAVNDAGDDVSTGAKKLKRKAN